MEHSRLNPNNSSIDKEINTQFGTNLSYDSGIPCVSQKGGDIENKPQFDNNTTIFDNKLTILLQQIMKVAQ